VRSAAAGSRLIVGIIDDDILLRNRYVGGIRIMGTLGQAPEIIAATRANTVVVACETSEEWMRVVRKTLEPAGVRVTHFRLVEEEITKGPAAAGERQER
jgi:FlaA1/EpsC-like NDP-sugar epimerase